jgi:hypothetical protein
MPVRSVVRCSRACFICVLAAVSSECSGVRAVTVGSCQLSLLGRDVFDLASRVQPLWQLPHHHICCIVCIQVHVQSVHRCNG